MVIASLALDPLRAMPSTGGSAPAQATNFVTHIYLQLGLHLTSRSDLVVYTLSKLIDNHPCPAVEKLALLVAVAPLVNLRSP